jgi:hypothetical protein
VRHYARLRAGRIVGLGLRIWFRRCLQIHAVATACLLPLFVVPELLYGPLASGRDAFSDGRLLGLFGVYPSGWAAALEFTWATGFGLNVAVAYACQFAVTVLLVRDAYRHLAGRAPRRGLKGLLALPLLAAAGLAVFSALDFLAMRFADEMGLWLPFAIAVTVAEVFLAGACWLAIPSAAVDGHGPASAVRRSLLLSRGSRSAVASLAVMLLAQQGLVFVPIGIVASSAGVDLGDLPVHMVAIPIVLFLTLKACILAAAYHEACYRKEGAGAEEISAIFA